MSPSRVTVVVPTLAADHALWDCVESLQRQSYRDYLIVVVDNSGANLAAAAWPPSLPRLRTEILHPGTNTGFGGAFNLAAAAYPADYVAVINDDAVASPEWLAELVAAMEANPQAGSAASQVRLHGAPDLLDSAGMLIAADGTSKQRGHGEPVFEYGNAGETLFASGSAALHRAAMLSDTGGFDESYFLYCEDTDLGLRARWAGWTCLYVPQAVVHHRYSHSAGRASRLKAYYVERNRLRTVIKNFPLPVLLLTFPATVARYWFHVISLWDGKGAAAEFQKGGNSPLWLVACVLRAHLAALFHLPALLRQRAAVMSRARIPVSQLRSALHTYRIGLRKVAAL